MRNERAVDAAKERTPAHRRNSKGLLVVALSVVLPGLTACNLAFPSASPGVATASPSQVGSSASPTASPTAAQPSPTSTAAADAGRRWARLPASQTFTNTTVVALAEYGSSLLATGSVVTPAQRRLDGAIWRSADGRSWTRVTGRSGFDNSAVTQIAQRPGGPLLALGSNCAFESECAGVITWTSQDGIRWSRVDSNFPDGASVRVVGGGPGWIAVGTESEPDGFAAAWTATNTRDWKRASGMQRIQVTMRGLVAAPSAFVAYGTAAAGTATEPAVWTSRDGTAWTRVPRAAAPTGLSGEAIALHGNLLVALARTARGLEVWTSTDGASWRHHPGAAAPFAINDLRAIRISRLVNGGPGLVAFGSAEVPSGLEPTGVWVSADGVTWQAAQDVSAFQNAEPVIDAIQYRGELYAVGRQSCSTDPCVMQSVFWISPPR